MLTNNIHSLSPYKFKLKNSALFNEPDSSQLGCPNFNVVKFAIKLTLFTPIIVSTLSYAALPQRHIEGVLVTHKDSTYKESASETPAAPSIVLDTVVITATRSERSLTDSPVPLQVISRDMLNEHHAHTLKDALALLPNVTLREIHGKTGYEVSMQGFTGDQVLVLIDGLPISSSTGSTVNLNQYMNMDIKQIEVIQGAASAQFGSAAMGGVINIITKPINKPKGHINIEVGTNGKQNPSGKEVDANKRYIEASIEGPLDTNEQFHARLSGSYLDNDGLSLNHDAWPRLKDASEQSQINARFTYQPLGGKQTDTLFQNTKFWLETSHYEEEDVSRFNHYVAPRYLAQHRNESITKQRYSIGAQTKLSPHTDSKNRTYQLSGQVLHEKYQSQSDTKTQETLTSARDTDITTTLAQAQIDFPQFVVSDQHTHLLQIGGQAQQDELSQTKNQLSELINDEVSRKVGEIYLQDDWFIGDNLEILSGVRYQNDKDFGDHTAPKVSVKYNHTDDSGHNHIIRASVGRGYRVPNLKERYYVFDHSNLGYKVMGNSNLDPETSTSYQIGYQSQLNDAMQLAVNGFYNEIDNLIQTDENKARYEGNIAIYEYMNVDSATTYGGDISLDWQVNNRANINASYTYLNTHNDTTDTQLTYKPEHKAALTLNYQVNDQLQFVPRLNYESKQLVSTSQRAYSPSWWTLDSTFNYNASDNLSLYLAINNIFDEQRKPNKQNDYRPIDNREWLLGAKYQW